MDLISIEQQQKKTFEISLRNHRFVSDMHREDGGDDNGPNPTELLAASLGTCIGMIAYEYCANHGMDSEGISVSVVVQLADNPRRVANFTIDLSLPEGFPDDRRQAIINASRRCVIYNTLMNAPEIDLELD